MFRKRLSRWFRLMTGTLFVAVVWMITMVIYLHWVINHDKSKRLQMRIPIRNRLRGILGHNQNVGPDFVQNVIDITDDSIESRTMFSSTKRILKSGKLEYVVDSSGPLYIDSKNEIGHVTKEEQFQFGLDQIQRENERRPAGLDGGAKVKNNVDSSKRTRSSTLGSRGQILPGGVRDSGDIYKRTTKFYDSSAFEQKPQTPKYQRLLFPFCANSKLCYLYPNRIKTRDEVRDLEQGMKQHAFNVYASEKRALDRRIPDTRPSSCLSLTIDITNLPSASIIICFHNEALSTLLRTLATVFLRTPSQLLPEVILVDDASNLDYLQSKLEGYINGSAKIKLIRLRERVGLTRARIAGAKASTGDVLVFLDSHCECNVGWLEPLLEEIRLNKNQIVCPDVDVIKPETFDYVRAPRNVHGSFDWNLNFQWESLPHAVMYQRHTEADKIPTPVMIGGLFAVDRNYFFKIGAYDEGMGIWGGENLEISFRVWMCGGRIDIIPCSRVGHVFRRTIPYKFPNGSFLTIRQNLIRVAEVWMDKYKQYYYASRAMPPGLSLDTESLASRKRLREKLKCHDFDWYLRTVAVGVDVPPIYAQYYGEVKSKRSGTCLDSLDADEGAQPLLMMCHGQRGNQLFYITVNGDFIHSDVCLAVSTNGDTVIFVACDTTPTKWIVTDDGQLQIVGQDKCLTVINLAVELTLCDRTDLAQKWKFTYHFDYSILKNFST